jgi:hypothetical protein
MKLININLDNYYLNPYKFIYKKDSNNIMDVIDNLINTNKNFKVYFSNRLFNMYDLRPGDCIIALVSINVLWENIK